VAASRRTVSKKRKYSERRRIISPSPRFGNELPAHKKKREEGTDREKQRRGEEIGCPPEVIVRKRRGKEEFVNIVSLHSLSSCLIVVEKRD